MTAFATSLGTVLLVLALLTCLASAAMALYGRDHDRVWVHRSRHAVYGAATMLTLCVVILETAFVRSDFGFQLVADHSSTTTPVFYRLTAMWSSQAGSLLLWAWVLSLASSAVLFATRNRHPDVVPYATAVLMGLGAFFTGLMLFDASPFVLLSPAPAEGVGLNPLLRHPSMMIHPPMLYSGYVTFSIPFAFCIGALAARRLDAAWIRSTRRFALIAWTFLSIGILLGARWSYTELGWGGYWGWDPVENASLMPWLAGTAFLHSIMVQERRGMFRVWNVSLIVGTFSLALLGTFLVRSGVLQSIHAFGASTVGAPILALIAVVLIGSTLLIVSRLDDLRSERRIDSLASRESMFVVNNLLLVSLCAVIFWGTFFPLISEAITGNKASLAAPWFDRYTTPLAILLVLFAGIGPLVAWRRFSATAAWRMFRWPALAAVVVAATVAALGDAGSKPLALALFSFAGFTLAAIAQEFWRGAAARRALSGERLPAAMLAVASRNRRRYGGYVVHVGIAVMLVGVAASSTFQTNRDLSLRPGQSASVGGYDVHYDRPTVDVDNERIAFGAILDVSRDGRRFATLAPTRNYYRTQDPSEGPVGRFFAGESTSEVGLRAGVGRDLWTAVQPNLDPLQPSIRDANRRFAKAPLQVQGLAIAAIADSYLKRAGAATFRVIVNPLVTWLWIGALIALVGALVGLWPARRGPPRGRPAVALADLEARKESKYREIRDAQLDHAAGKLSDDDFRHQDAELRGEAAEILRELDAAKR
jgi:cytochrome c-type biogenesis protein CcmF